MQVDSGKAPVIDIVQVEDGRDKIQDTQKGPMIVEKSVDPSQNQLALALVRPSFPSHDIPGELDELGPAFAETGLTGRGRPI